MPICRCRRQRARGVGGQLRRLPRRAGTRQPATRRAEPDGPELGLWWRHRRDLPDDLGGTTGRDACLGASPEPGRPQDPDPVPARQGERAMRLPRSRGFFLALTGLALAVVLLANAHLVYVASTSQPECVPHVRADRSEEHTSELQSLMRISYAVFC